MRDIFGSQDMVSNWAPSICPQHILNIFSTYLLIGEMLSQLWSLGTHVHLIGACGASNDGAVTSCVVASIQH